MLRLARELALLAVVGTALSGCSFVKSFQHGYVEGFRKQFAASFVSSCATRPGTTDYCKCASAYLLDKYPGDQLVKLKDDEMKAALAQAGHSCAAKLPKPSH